jgi:hypothetical protein
MPRGQENTELPASANGQGVQGARAVAGQAAAGSNNASTTVVARRAKRHMLDSLEVQQYKPLGLMDGFKPSKTCSEYVEQDCAEALPAFRPHAQALLYHGCEVGLGL